MTYGTSGVAFVDRTALATSSKARFIGYAERHAPWADVFDGAVSFRTMTPVVQMP